MPNRKSKTGIQKIGRILSNKQQTLRLKPVDNYLFFFKKMIPIAFKAIARFMIKTLRTRKSQKLKKLLILRALIVVAIVASRQASEIKSSQPQIGQTKRIFALVMKLVKTKSLTLQQLASILLQSKRRKRFKQI